MNTRQIEYILEIARQKNMQRAADRLFVSQSSLSQTLIKLEKELGCQLFRRDSREMVLTQEGEVYVRGGQEILNIKERAYQQIQSLSSRKKTSYRIGISSAEGMDRFLTASGELQKAWDSLEIYAIEDNFKNLMDKLRQHHVNLAITTWHSVADLEFPYRILQQEEIKLVVPEGWCPREFGICPAAVSWERLIGEQLVLPNPGSTVRTMVDNMLQKENIHPKVACQISSVRHTLRMVQQSGALAFLPEHLLVGQQGFCALSLIPRLTRYLIVTYNEEVEQDEIMQHFITLLTNPVD